MLSDRTAKYFEALIREGPNFNYLEWFRRVQGEEAQVKHRPEALPQDKPLAPEMSNPTIASESQNAGLNLAPAVMNKTAPSPK